MKNTFRKINQFFIGEDTKDITVSDYAWFYGAPLLASAIALSTVFGGTPTEASAEPKDTNVAIETPYYGTNVGDGQTYSYIVTELKVVDGVEEVHGLPVTKGGTGNRGIFLYASELDFEVEVGEFVHVVWGEEEDEFASITKGGMFCELTK